MEDLNKEQYFAGFDYGRIDSRPWWRKIWDHLTLKKYVFKDGIVIGKIDGNGNIYIHDLKEKNNEPN